MIYYLNEPYLEVEKISMRLKIQVKKQQPLILAMMGYIWCFCNLHSMFVAFFCVWTNFVSLHHSHGVSLIDVDVL